VTEGAPIPRPVLCAVCAPLAAGVVLLLGFIVAELSGSSVFTYESPRNLAEAAGMATGAGVMRFLRAGEDPAAIVYVRPEVISSSITRVTALEAAVWGRQVELVRLLDRQGAIAGPERRREMACLSEALQADDITSYLAPSGTEGCDPEATMRRIEDRSR
jgi:hypothetical protein